MALPHLISRNSWQRVYIPSLAGKARSPVYLMKVLLHTGGNKFVEFITPRRRCRQEIEMDSDKVGQNSKW